MNDDADLAALAATLSAPPAFNVDFSLGFTDPRPGALLALWRSKCRGPLIPGRADFDPASLKPHLGWLCIAEVLPDADDLRYTLIGSAIVEVVGRDATRMRVSEVLPAPALAIYRHLIAHPRPARTHGSVAWREKGFIQHETLLLPLAADGVRVDRFLIEMAFPTLKGRNRG